MTLIPAKPYRKWPAQLVVLAVLIFLSGMSTLPSPDRSELDVLASRFRFEMTPLVRAPVPAGMFHGINKTVRHLRGYLYGIGASVAMADLDGDGLANDLCYTDIAAKALMIAPAPGTGARYSAFPFDFGAHVDLTSEYPMRCSVADMNEDGFADIYVGFGGRAPLLLLRKDHGQQGPEPLSTASFAIQELVPDGARQRWHSPTATYADIDGDGHFDLIVGNYFADGADIFSEDSDAPFEMNDTFCRAENGGKDRVFLWAGAKGGESPEVTFTDAGDVFPDRTAYRWAMAIGAADIDRDGLSDLYVANDFGTDLMVLNRSTPGKVRLLPLEGDGGFMIPRSFILGKDTFKGMGIDFADVNHDGMFDIAISNISTDFALAEGHFLWLSTGGKEPMEKGIAPYWNAGTKLGISHSAWGWDIRMDDFDNDGEEEIVQATGFMKGTVNRWTNLQQFVVLNDRLAKDPRSWPEVDFGSEVDGHKPNPFWVRGENGEYVDVSREVFPGVLPNTRGIATADVDGDGDLDMVYANAWEDSLHFRNESPRAAFLGLHLLLPLETREGGVHDGHPKWREGTPATGALVELVHPDGRRLSRQVDGGNGHSGSRSQDLVIGLGKLAADTSLAVRVTWRDRSGAVQRSNLQLKPGWHTVTLASNIAGQRLDKDGVNP